LLKSAKTEGAYGVGFELGFGSFEQGSEVPKPPKAPKSPKPGQKVATVATFWPGFDKNSQNGIFESFLAQK